MDAGSPGDDVAALIERSRGGDSDAARALFERLHGELRALAASVFRSQRAGHTLQPTALVHEAFLRLRDSQSLEAGSSASFRSTAAVAMRRILVDHARQRLTSKRGGDRRRVPLDETAAALGLSRRTVLREWSYARARLFAALRDEAPGDG